MIDVSTSSTPVAEIEAGALVVGAYESDDAYELSEIAAAVDTALDGALSEHLDALRFEAKRYRVRSLAAGPGVAAAAVIVVGLGATDDLDADVLRRASAAAERRGSKFDRLASGLAAELEDLGAATAACVEGTLLAADKFVRYKSDAKTSELEEFVVVGGDADAAARGRAAANAQLSARALANTPARDMRPRQLAEAAERVAAEAGLDADVWALDRIDSEGLGGLIAVASGSVEEPRLIRLTYTPSGVSKGTLVLVGKGITFDSGGLSLKPADNMEKQKTDMSGGAAVISAMSVLDELAPQVTVIGIVPTTENMPGPNAIKPGDVFAARNSKTVEVLNTDAEGRLVLADGLSLAAEAEPDAIVDLATLTGACIVALGTKIAGLFSNNEALAEQLLEAAGRSGEPLWRLPLAEQYRKHLDSEVADLRNIGQRGGGAITAALFLREFVGDVAWAHLDICGPARSDAADGYTAKGATGFAVRTLIELIDGFEPPKAD